LLQTCELPTTNTNTNFSLMVGISIDGLQLFFWWEILYCCEVLRNFCGEINAFFKLFSKNFKILKTCYIHMVQVCNQKTIRMFEFIFFRILLIAKFNLKSLWMILPQLHQKIEKKNNDGYLAKLQSNQLDITTRNW